MEIHLLLLVKLIYRLTAKAYAVIKKAANTGINLFTDMPTDKQIASDVKEADK